MTIIEKLQLQRQQCQTKIKNIQSACTHPDDALTKVAKSDTGHWDWDRNDDSYWHEMHCHLCDKRWNVDLNVWYEEERKRRNEKILELP